jgi:hypothetical protein
VGAIEFVIDPKLGKTLVDEQEPKEEPLDNEVPLELWSAASAIQDKELRRKFLKTAALALRRKR